VRTLLGVRDANNRVGPRALPHAESVGGRGLVTGRPVEVRPRPTGARPGE
jgi:hypothetical protein